MFIFIYSPTENKILISIFVCLSCSIATLNIKYSVDNSFEIFLGFTIAETLRNEKKTAHKNEEFLLNYIT